MAKVILLDQYAGLGGGQRILADLARAFEGAGHGVAVMVPGRGRVRADLEAEGFPVLDLPLRAMTPGRKPLSEKLGYPLSARRAAAAIEEAARSSGADLLYANGPRTYLPAVWAARRLGVPVVCGLHLIFTRGLERRLIRWCLARPEVRAAVFCSEAVAGPVRDACPGKARLVHYWVSPEFLGAQDRAGARQAMGLHGHQVAVGVLGRISRTKGQRLFLEALLPLLEAFPRLTLYVAGSADFEDAGEASAVRALAAGAGDPARVVLTEAMVESRPFLDAMDVLVVPSLWEEPFGLVAVEGMARSLPVVATRSGGLTEIVEDGVTGIQTEKTASSLREAVARLVAEPVVRARMGEAGRARVEERFHPVTQMAKILEACFGEG